MKRLVLIPILLFLSASFYSSFPHTSSAVEDYHLLAPLPGLETFSSDSNIIEKYFSNIYQLGISLIIVLAVVMLVFGGIQYMMTDSITKKGEARDTIVAAVVGLILAVGSYAILTFIIGDRATSFDFITELEPIKMGQAVELEGTCEVSVLANRWGAAVKDTTPKCFDLFGRKAGISGSKFRIEKNKDLLKEITDKLSVSEFVCKGEPAALIGANKPYEVRFSGCFDVDDLFNPVDSNDPVLEGPRASICSDETFLLATSSLLHNNVLNYIVALNPPPDDGQNYGLSVKEYGFSPEDGTLNLISGSIQNVSISGSEFQDGRAGGEITLRNVLSFNKDYPGVIRLVLTDSNGDEIHEYYMGVEVNTVNCN